MTKIYVPWPSVVSAEQALASSIEQPPLICSTGIVKSKNAKAVAHLRVARDRHHGPRGNLMTPIDLDLHRLFKEATNDIVTVDAFIEDDLRRGRVAFGAAAGSAPVSAQVPLLPRGSWP